MTDPLAAYAAAEEPELSYVAAPAMSAASDSNTMIVYVELTDSNGTDPDGIQLGIHSA